MLTLLIITLRLALLVLVAALVWKALVAGTSRQRFDSPDSTSSQRRFDGVGKNIADADFEEIQQDSSKNN